MSTSQSLPAPIGIDPVTRDKHEIKRANILKFFTALLAVTFLLRIFYSGHLLQDDGFWFTAGEEVLRGKALYREVYFDKPPALPMVYALAFWIFGTHIIVIRLLTILYSLAISAVLYCFGSRLYDRRAGMLAAAMFTFFSTTSVNNHEQGLNTDMLMVLPYAASAYVFARACFERRKSLSLIGGILTGLAVQANPKGVFALLFFVILLVVTRRWHGQGIAEGPTGRGAQGIAEERRSRGAEEKSDSPQHLSTSAPLLLFSLLGFVASTIPFLIYTLANHSFSGYWLFVWEWGSTYANYFPVWATVGRSLKPTATFFARNNTLVFGFVFVLVITARALAPRANRSRAAEQVVADNDGRVASHYYRSDITLLIWFIVSYAGLAVGGRFYSNYFIQVLPSLCLIGGRGLIGLYSTLKGSSRVLRRVVLFVIAVGFVITLVRFHTRTAGLAFDWIRGTRSAATASWYHEKLNREERMVAATVRDLPETAENASALKTEAMRADSPRTRGVRSNSDYLFVWGSRAEIYYWSGLLPASRYLSTQPLTGVPADVHHEGNSQSVLDESITAAARAQLIVDLEQTRPKYIVDELGFFNSESSIQNYPELLRKLTTDYERLGANGPFLIYRRKPLTD